MRYRRTRGGASERTALLVNLSGPKALCVMQDHVNVGPWCVAVCGICG